MDLNGVKQAVASFWGNDPYYPRPGKDPVVWNAFRERYIQISGACIDFCEPQEAERHRILPNLFIQLVEQEGKRRREEKDVKGAYIEPNIY